MRRIGSGDYATAGLQRSPQVRRPVWVGANPGDFTPQAHEIPAI